MSSIKLPNQQNQQTLCIKITKHVTFGYDFRAQNAQSVFAAMALPHTTLGELMALSMIP